jgi:hypothetical protein
MKSPGRILFNGLALASLLLCVVVLLAWAATRKAHLYKGEINLHYYKGVPLTAILPLTWFGHWVWRSGRRQDRLMFGLCPECGYDLRASKGRCPECGTAAAGKA